MPRLLQKYPLQSPSTIRSCCRTAPFRMRGAALAALTTALFLLPVVSPQPRAEAGHHPSRALKNLPATTRATNHRDDTALGSSSAAKVPLFDMDAASSIYENRPGENTTAAAMTGAETKIGTIRRWTDVIDLSIKFFPMVTSGGMRMVNAPSHDNYEDPDVLRLEASSERDAFFFTGLPSSRPSYVPSMSQAPSGAASSPPSSAPSAQPSSRPSQTPTTLLSMTPSAPPSSPPTTRPTSSPTLTPTTLSPTITPTADPFVPNPAPSNPPSSYFDYRTSSRANRGVQDWDKVGNPDEERYWADFKEWIKPSLGNNQCGSNSDRQSPIDISFDTSKGFCREYHQIRHKRGEYDISESSVDKQILPSKLRVVYPRKWEFGENGNDLIKGPSADIPKSWGHQLPVLHIDLKVPSEHTLEGKTYAAEYQIHLIQNRPSQRGAPVISVLFEVNMEDKPNKMLQELLDEFQAVWNWDMAQCESKRRRGRRLGALARQTLSNWSDNENRTSSHSTWLDEPTEVEAQFQTKLKHIERRAQKKRPWDCWNDEIMRSVWFFGYEGSLTEPPCTEFVEWRIIDTPALISQSQLFQMKTLLFGHVDKNCKKTSVHWDHSVARPVQPRRGRDVHRCMCRDYIADDLRDKYGSNRCEWKDRDTFGFNKDMYTKEWYETTHDEDNL